MRFNERELLSLSRQPAEKAAEVLMRAPKKGSVLKKRLVKLVVNFLFYFRTDEAEPIGALLLEHCRIHQEENNVFSIGFLEEPDRKYYFECDTAEQCQEWVEVLKRASYEFITEPASPSVGDESRRMWGRILWNSTASPKKLLVEPDIESTAVFKQRNSGALLDWNSWLALCTTAYLSVLAPKWAQLAFGGWGLGGITLLSEPSPPPPLGLLVESRQTFLTPLKEQNTRTSLDRLLCSLSQKDPNAGT
uniref:Uncharacterized protein n=1 Tax=Sphaerodactylus townsendi TaxID=933632 RepID=A0ACB8F1H1_9SAUR